MKKNRRKDDENYVTDFCEQFFKYTKSFRIFSMNLFVAS